MSKENLNILVVGSNGYLGSNLAYTLIQSGYSVRLSDIQDTSYVDGGDYHRIDFTDANGIKSLIDGIDVIYFFAGKTGNSDEGFNNPATFILGNEITLVNMLNIIKEFETKPRIIFPSTRLLYEGDSSNLIDENSNIDPKSIYAINKLACENYLKVYHDNFDIDYTIFRISLPYGSLTKQMHVSYGVMSYLIDQAKNGNELFIYGDGKQRGSLIHVFDLVEILIRAGLSELTLNDMFNVGGPDHLEIGEVVSSIANRFDVPVSTIPWPKTSKRTDQGDLVFSSEKLNKLLNVDYKYTFHTWLSQSEQ